MDSEPNQPTEETEPSIDGRFRLKISRDSMSVSIHHLTAPTGDGKPVDLKKVLAKLKQSKVVEGINKEAIETVLAATVEGNPPAEPVIIVESLKPVKSEDSQLNWAIDPESDIRTRIILPGQLLLSLKPATSGEPGRNVHGKKVRIRPGLNRAIKAENGVYQKIVKGVMEYYSETFGVLECKDDKLSVTIPSLVASEDGLSASMDITLPVTQDKGGITKKHVIDALKAQRICFGVNEGAIDQAIKSAESANDGCARNINVANGKPAVNSKDGYLEWLIEINGEDELSRIVIPGQPFAAVHSPTTGEAGLDVYNKSITPVAGKEVTLKAGDGVAIRQAKGYVEHIASALGVASKHDDTVEVIAPAVKISPDGLEASMDLYTRSAGMNACNVEVAHVIDLLKRHNVIFGVDEEAIAKLLTDAQQSNSKLIKHAIVARGVAAAKGKVGNITWHIETDAEDRLKHLLLPGQVIASHVLATPGKPGKDVLGKELQPKAGHDEAFSVGEGISIVASDGVEKLVADSLGFYEVQDGVSLLHGLEVVVSPDKLSATMDVIGHSGGEFGVQIEASHIVQYLKSSNISFGINEDAINKALEQARNAPEGMVTQVEVAKGKPPVNGKDGYLEWLIDIDSEDIADRIVVPEQPIVIRYPAIKGEAGMDVHGGVTPFQTVHEVTIKNGQWVAAKMEDLHEELYAMSIGAVEFSKDSVSVHAANLHISDDKLAATLDIFAKSGGKYSKDIKPEYIYEMLENSGIIHGVNQKAIKTSLALASQKGPVKDVVVASGTIKKDGIMAYLELAHDLSPAIKLSGGRLDLHELDYPWDVKKGMQLGKFFQSEMAEDGLTVTGKADAAKKVKEIEPELSNIRLDETGNLISEMDGSFMVDGFKLEVTDLVVIKGNVNLHTGNIHTESAVLVKGHVTQGFIVEAKGEVIVEQNIEDAVVKSESRVTVRGGIRGHSKIYSGGDFSCGFIEFGEVVAEDDIEILKNAVDSNLVAGNNITIDNGQGIVIASKCIAGNEIWVGKIGQPSSEVC